MSKKVAEIIVETLAAAGVKHCYGIVGDTLNLIAQHISESEIEWVHMRHEEAGAFAAEAEAMLTGNLTAVAGSCGPGSLHFINGLVDANRNRAPVILIATQVASEEIGFNFPQELDFKAIYGSCTVFCDTIITPEQARRKTVIACQTAITKGGVAVLIVPVDIAHMTASDDTPYTVHTNAPIVRPSDADLDRAAEILNSGEKIVIYGGAGCRGAHAEILAAAELLKAPIAHTSRGKDALEHNNPYNVGMTGIIGGVAGYQAVAECETLLLLGADFAWKQFYPANAKIVQIDIASDHIGRRHPVTLGLVGDIQPTMEALLPRLKRRTATDYLDKLVSRHEKAIQSHREKAVPSASGTIPPTYLTELINRHAASDALFCADDGTPTVWLYRHVETNGKRRVFSSLLHGTMAAAMPMALGLQKCQPGRQVISMSGDGGIAMMFGELMTAVQEKLPIKIVVFDNGKLGFIDIEQKSEGMIPLFTDLQNPDFGKVAEAMGFWGRTVTKADGLEQAVVQWLNEPGPALLNVKVDPMTLVMPPKIELRPMYGMALYSAKAILNGQSADVFDMIKQNI
ncbi:thiamine pyrophosphate-dependent enzyme [Caballeronia sp. dw_276]|uniref:thiamine pyrophosphate-dependent enzyme n=1 Tax=Caballeronia sp. dw_276 TaxID=2719795 RepID=UPI001BD42D87|nr:thiamine pyrophosphate-dependent enzyme [Caballeronia sp. dw_276]